MNLHDRKRSRIVSRVRFAEKCSIAKSPRHKKKHLHSILEVFPIAFLGLALSLTGLSDGWHFVLGNSHIGAILASFIQITLNTIAFTLVFAYGMKALLCPGAFSEETDSIDGHACLCAGTMVMSKLCSSLSNVCYEICLLVWFASLGMHILLLIKHIALRFRHFKALKLLDISYWSAINPTLFLPTVGIAIFSISANKFGDDARRIGIALFWFSLTMCIIIQSLLIYRMFFEEINSLKPSQRYLFFIFIAPSALLGIAHERIGAPFKFLISILLTIQCISSIVLIVFLTKRVRLKFKYTPSCCAVTFPCVVNATSVAFFKTRVDSNQPLTVFAFCLISFSSAIVICISFQSARWLQNAYLTKKIHPYAETELEKVGPPTISVVGYGSSFKCTRVQRYKTATDTDEVPNARSPYPAPLII